MVTLQVRVRFSHHLPDDLENQLETDEGASNFHRHNSTLTFQAFDSVDLQQRIHNWMQQTCLREGDVQSLQVTRLGP